LGAFLVFRPFLRFTGDACYLEVLSGTALLSLDEFFPWLSSSESLAPFLKNVRSLKGMVSVSSMNFAGPLTQPALERMLVTGETQGVIVDSKLFPAPLAVSGIFLTGTVSTLNLSAVKSSCQRRAVRCGEEPAHRSSAGRDRSGPVSMAFVVLRLT
jgi:hypothetical protein